MIQKLQVNKDSSFQGHASKVYTPRSLMPFIYCQDGSAVPVIYGVVKTEGTIIYNAPGGTSVAKLSAWMIICCGKIKKDDPITGKQYFFIYKNTDQMFIVGTDYFMQYLNDGTEAYYPSVIDAASKLGGIAHIFFGHDPTVHPDPGTCRIATNADKKMPDMRFIVQRADLQAGVINTPDIVFDTVERPSGQTWVGGAGYLGRQALQGTYVYPHFIDHLGRIRLVGMYQINDYIIVPPQANEPTLVDVPQKGAYWQPSTSYTTFIPKSTGDLVIGYDNHIYKCIQPHTSDFTTQPNIGSDWQTYWGYYGSLKPFYDFDGPNKHYHIRQGDIILGVTDGMPYRAIRDGDLYEADLPDWLPASATKVYWLDLWCPANGKPWIYAYDYVVGEEATGTDGNLYRCITPHVANESNRPILMTHQKPDFTVEIIPSDWSPYWEVSGTQKFIGNNPAAIAYDILTNTFYGVGIPTEQLDIDSFNVAADYYATKKYGLNIKITDINEARQTLSKLFDWCDLILTIGTDGLIQCKVLDPEATPVGTLYDVDFSSFNITRQTWRELYNEFEATYTEPTRAYEAASIELKNEAAILMADGIVKKKSVDLSAFVDKIVAFDRLKEIMHRESYPRDSVSCEVSGAWSFVRPGDLINVVKTEYSVDSVFRVMSVDTGKIDELSISLQLIEATEVLFKQWSEPEIPPGPHGRRRRLMSPMGSPFTQGE